MKLIFTLILVCSSVCFSFGQWSSFSTINNVVCDTLSTLSNGVKRNINAVKDNANNTFVTWADFRTPISGSNQADIYLQKISPLGNQLFRPGGVVVCDAIADQAGIVSPAMIYDGKGGVILAWNDSRNATTQASDIYYQRLDSNGIRLYTIPLSLDSNGLNVTTDSVRRVQTNPELVLLDDTYFAIVWQDNRFRPSPSRVTLFYNKYRISDGLKIGATSKKVTGNILEVEAEHKLMPEGNGGFYVVWSDRRLGSSNTEVYFQKVDSNMDTIFSPGTGGLSLSESVGLNQQLAQLCSDGAGGAIIAWEDSRLGFNQLKNIFAQRVSIAGVKMWSNTLPAGGGVQVTTAVNDQENVRIMADGSGNAIIAWQDERTSDFTVSPAYINNDIYATKLNGVTGLYMWNDNSTFGANDGSIPICTEGADQPASLKGLSIVSDKNGGSIIIWEDAKNVSRDVYGMRVNEVGTKMWTPDQGVVIANASTVLNTLAVQGSPIVLSGNSATGPDGAIIVFLDGRNTPVPILSSTETTAIFASYVSTSGSLVSLGLDKINLTASKLSSNVSLNWSASNNASALKYILQKSNDGIRFYDLATLISNTSNNYNHIDFSPSNGVNFYRVKVILNTYLEKISNTVNVIFGENKNVVNFYPNPVLNNANVQINKVPFGAYALNIYATDGKLVAKQKITINSDAYSASLPLSILAQGQYILQLVNGGGKTLHSQSFIKSIP